ncbi:unnamed protein product, partial [Durusdinium trenchii]
VMYIIQTKGSPRDVTEVSGLVEFYEEETIYSARDDLIRDAGEHRIVDMDILCHVLEDLLSKLDAFLHDQKDKEKDLNVDKTIAMIEKCSSVPSVIRGLEASSQDGAQQLKNELQETVGRIQSFLSDCKWGTFNFTEMLDNMCHGTVEVKINETEMAAMKAAVIEGAVASRLFTADDTTKGKAIQTILLQSFVEYHSLCPEQEDPPFDAACSLFANMSTQLTSKAVIALNPDWLASAQSACKRLQDATVKCGKSWASSAWQSGGPDEVCERCKFVPGELQPILNLAKNHHILEDLKPIDDPPLSDLDKELPHLMRPVKKWMSVLSLQTGMIEEFYAAEIVQNVKDFHASVVNAIEKVIGMSLDHFIKVKPLLERLRPVLTAVETWELDVINPLLADQQTLEKHVENILDWRRDSQIVEEFLRTLTNIQKFDGWKDDPLRGSIIKTMTTLEDWTEQKLVAS